MSATGKIRQTKVARNNLTPEQYRGVTDALFGRFAVEMLVVGLRARAGVVVDAVRASVGEAVPMSRVGTKRKMSVVEGRWNSVSSA